MSDNKDLGDIFTDVTGEESVTESQEEENNTRIRDEDSDVRSRTEVVCNECGNNTAFYEMKQIRAADESETRFFECTECGYKWREDDH